MSSDEELLELAIEIATKYHAGQTDKAGEPYINHCMRVMERCRQHGTRAMMVGVLHDIVEDTPLTMGDLWGCQFPAEVIFAIGSLSRGKSETRYGAILRVAENELGRVVKIEDIEDHLEPVRVRFCPSSLLNHYQRALRYLKSR